MKRILLGLLFSIILTTVVLAQQEQASGDLKVRIESTRVIGDQLLVSGKMFVNQEIRLMNIKVNAVTADGDSHSIRELWWGGKTSSISAFDHTLQADIPYSFDMAIPTQNKNMDPITALMINLRDWAKKTDLKLVFKDVKVPMTANPNLVPGVIEIGKDIYLKWTKFEESTTGLKVSFVIENKANRDQEMSFRSFDNAKIIDKDGNIYKGEMPLRDRVNFPAGTPIAGYVSIKEKVKMADVLMIQFESSHFKYSIKDITFPK